jgi:hypothetical protein
MRRLLLLLAVASPALAQQPRSVGAGALREVRIQFTDEWARVAESGVLTFPRQGLMARATVVGIDTAGKPMSVGRLAPRWSTSDATVVSTYGNPSDNPVGAAVGLVAQEDGRAAVTVTVAGKSATLPVVVGKARLAIAPSELAPKFRLTRLELIADVGAAGPEADASASGLTLRENGHGVLLRPRAIAAGGTEIPVEHFPVTWTSSDDKVVELFQTTDTTAQITSHEPGTATVTVTLQGTTATVNVQVVKMGTTVGPMRGAQLVATATGAIPMEKEEVASVAAARSAVPRSSGVAIATTTAARTSGTTGTVLRTAPAPIGTQVVAAPTGVRATAIGDTAATAPPAAQPTNFRATSGAGYVQLQWDAVPGAAGYTLARLENGVATPLDDHYPARTPRLERNDFVDARGPGTTVGYVLSAVYRTPDGGEVAGDPAVQPRTAATPRAFEAGTNAGIDVTGFANQSNTLWVDYRTAAATGWVSAIALEVLEPAGWRQVNGQSFSWQSTSAQYRAVPGVRSGRLALDPNIPLGCDYAKTFRFKVTRSVGGDTASQQQVGVDLSRPFTVTYDNTGSRCHP